MDSKIAFWHFFCLVLVLFLFLSSCKPILREVPVDYKQSVPPSSSSTTLEEGATAAPIAPLAPSGAGNNFNVAIDLPQTYQQIAAGNELWFTTKLVNLKNQQRVDVALTYEILDAGRQIQFSKSETVAIETQASFVAHLQTPPTLTSGLHYLRARVTSPYGESLAETTFNVVAQELQPQIVIKFSLFDIQVEIPHTYKVVQPGGDLLTSIKLINVGTGGRIDIFLDYWITDEKGNSVLQEKETVAVETQNNFVRTFTLPDDAVPGKYTFHARVSYPGLELQPEYATTFTIAKKENFQLYALALALLGSVLVFLFFTKFNFIKLFFEHRRIRKRVDEIVKGRKW